MLTARDYLLREVNKLATAMQDIVAAAEADNRSISSEEGARIVEMLGDARKMKVQIAEMDDRQAISDGIAQLIDDAGRVVFGDLPIDDPPDSDPPDPDAVIAERRAKLHEQLDEVAELVFDLRNLLDDAVVREQKRAALEVRV